MFGSNDEPRIECIAKRTLKVLLCYLLLRLHGESFTPCGVTFAIYRMIALEMSALSGELLYQSETVLKFVAKHSRTCALSFLLNS